MRNIKKFLSASISFVLILSMLIGVLNVSNVFASPQLIMTGQLAGSAVRLMMDPS